MSRCTAVPVKVTDQDQSVGYSCENESQGSDPLRWHCGLPSSSPSGETPARMPSCPLPHLEGRSPNLGLDNSKKRISKPAHMRRNIRKLLKEHHLDAVTKVAQLEETERRKRLDQQRNNFTVAPELVYTHTLGDLRVSVTYGSKESAACVQTSNSSNAHSTEVSVLQTTAPTRDQSSVENTTSCFISKSANEDYGESSGVHLNDAVNQPDAQGRVLINVNHPEDETDIYLSPQLARIVKPHQIGGIRFLYNNLVESQKRFKSTPGFGCILAHSMGLGKTLQVISFIDILLRHTGAHTVLAIVPVNTLHNWLAEFNLWVPPAEALPPDNDPGHITPRTFKVHILNDEHKTTSSRAKVVEDWYRDGGVLLMGYEMYRLLSLKKSFVTGRKKKNTKPHEPVIIDVDKEDHQQVLMKGIERALAQPGPDVVVCDEGHRIKNWHASTSRALKAIGTRRRLVLTGYPLQNNLYEYWCMVDFVRPGFLGTRPEFSNMFVRPILNGQCMDSTPEDVQLMRYRSHVLHSLLEGFVQRRGHDVLCSQLPQKQEHVILVRLTALQRALYVEFMNRFREAGNTGWLSLNPLKAFCVCCKIWNHPDILFEALQRENMASDQDLDLDDITASNAHCSANQRAKSCESGSSQGELTLSRLQEKTSQVITYEWAKDIMAGYKKGILENSAKMVLFFHIIEESIKSGDKVLVFSQSLSTLTVIEEFLVKRTMPDYSGSGVKQTWVRNVNYYRLDGSTSVSERERLINQFNDVTNNSAWLFLLSTRAGCLGVNLIGANRVVVFDASWNPCHDAQAVCRVYRYGQRKPCHIYRLVSDFTLEKKIYDRQISKQGMSDRVIDDLNPVLTFTRREVESLLHFVEEEPDPLDSAHLLHPQEDMETVLRKACMRYPHLITKQPFHHESLLMDRQDLKLTKEEKQAAKKSYENEKRASVPYTRPSYAHYYPASDQSLTNIPAFSQRNWRPPSQPEAKPAASIHLAQTNLTPIMHQKEGQKEDQKESQGSAPSMRLGSKSALNFPVTYLQKAGVFVQKTVTTTDIVIPGANNSSETQTKISAGESIHIIRGTKGTYIRTSDGRIFAIRAVRKSRQSEESTNTKKDVPPSLENSISKSTSCSVSPDDMPKVLTPKAMTRPLSPDTPEILSELQCYTKVPSLPPSGVANPETASEKGVMILPQNSTASPGMEVPLDLRGTKRKSTSPSTNEYSSKQPTPEQRGSVPPSGHNYPFTGTYGLNSTVNPGVNRALLSSLNSVWSPYFQPQVPIAEHQLMFQISPDTYNLRDRALPSSSPTSSSITSSTAATSSSSTSVPSSCLVRHEVPGMLAPTFLSRYGQPLGMYSSTLMPQGIPGQAGSSFLPQYASSGPQGGANESCRVAENGAPRPEDNEHICDNHDDVIAMMDQ
ncbi:helicase ARIP4-like isoform X3 [Pangasianodon hypophthalmus]|uniref:helicase ARIP4-like isoform X3 n=1 Tax=Pangasianodon hypophthalmus TaxID=310915 RepID=UPI002307B31C|nr:helicase ARIP4-like isoform X3 [Pangasianodon hypophthalmus]